MYNVSEPAKYWAKANLSLVAKILSELHFEELLSFKEVEKVITRDKTANRFFEERLVLNTEKATWIFDVRRTIWGMLLIDEDSISRDGEDEQCAGEFEAVQLLLDIQNEIGISDIHLSGFIEELQQTLYSDCICLMKSNKYSAEDLVLMNELARQQCLSAHPKALANKGRLGWGQEALNKYAPESGRPIHLHCFAVKKKPRKLGFKMGSVRKFFGLKPLENINGKGLKPS